MPAAEWTEETGDFLELVFPVSVPVISLIIAFV